MRRALLSLSVSAAALCAASPAFAAEPTPGASPLIRTWKYNPKVPLELTSVGGQPLVLVLGDGEAVLHRTSSKVVSDLKQATELGGWFMPFNAAAAQEAGAQGKAPGAVQDQVTLQPTKADDPGPVLLQMMTVSKDGERRPWLILLRSTPGNVADPKTGGYVQVLVEYPARPDPVAVAAAAAEVRERRADARRRRDEDRVAFRLAQAQATAAVVNVNRDYEAAPGRNSHNGCTVLKPVDTWDNGVQTTLTFDPRQPAPKVYTFTSAGAEPTLVHAIPATRADGGYDYVLPGVFYQLRVVAEGQVCGLRNKAFGRAPVSTATGTISADVAVIPRGR